MWECAWIEERVLFWVQQSMDVPWPCVGDIPPLVRWLQPEEAQGEREKNGKWTFEGDSQSWGSRESLCQQLCSPGLGCATGWGGGEAGRGC